MSAVSTKLPPFARSMLLKIPHPLDPSAAFVPVEAEKKDSQGVGDGTKDQMSTCCKHASRLKHYISAPLRFHNKERKKVPSISNPNSKTTLRILSEDKALIRGRQHFRCTMHLQFLPSVSHRSDSRPTPPLPSITIRQRDQRKSAPCLLIVNNGNNRL